MRREGRHMEHVLRAIKLICGYFANAFAHDATNTAYGKIRDKLIDKRKSSMKRKPPMKRKKGDNLEPPYTFTLDKRETSVVVIDGDGEDRINSENIRVHITESISPPWPEEVEQYYVKTESEMRRKDERGEKVPWNGPVFSLRSYSIGRTSGYEEKTIDLFFVLTRYYWIYSTIHNLGSGRGSLRKKYIDNFLFDNDSTYILPNGFGICMQVRTSDNKAIFAVRSNSCGFRPGENDVSVVEGLNPVKDYNGGKINFDEITKRALREEICKFEEKETSIALLGMIFDEEYNQWNIIGFINLKLTEDEILKRRNKGTSDKWELQSLNFIPFTLEDIMFYLSTHPMWDAGLVTVYFSLVYNRFKDKEIEECAKRFLK